MNLQDTFLGEYKESWQELTVFLMNGFQLQGKIVDYDKYVVELDSDGKIQIIYNHAISTFVRA